MKDRNQLKTSAGTMSVASFFSGAGGLDEGFKQAGFFTSWANEIDNAAADTFELNHKIKVDRRSIVDVVPNDLPRVDGIIGGPPCQSWSAAGAKRGASDPRGALFFEYVRMIGKVRPKFFLAENVQGLLSARNAVALDRIVESLSTLGYKVTLCLLNAADYGVPQTRKRVFIVGFRSDLGIEFFAPPEVRPKRTLRDALSGLTFESGVPVNSGESIDFEKLAFPNHHYWAGNHFSYIYMSRNRRRQFDQASFTIQASASHAPLHPMSAPMIKVATDRFEFVRSDNRFPRRLTVRECARIQTFPDTYVFKYRSINDGYKQIGNAVPVLLAKAIATQISAQLRTLSGT